MNVILTFNSIIIFLKRKNYNTVEIELWLLYNFYKKSRAIKEFPIGLDEFLLGNSKYYTNDLTHEIPIFKELIQFDGEVLEFIKTDEPFLIWNW